MKYEKIVQGVFIERPNRFVAKVEIDSRVETAHVKNTGRCRELLPPGATVYLSDEEGKARKTRYDLVAALKDKRLINMDSQAPNAAVGEALQQGLITPDMLAQALRSTDRLLAYIHQGRFSELTACMSDYIK